MKKSETLSKILYALPMAGICVLALAGAGGGVAAFCYAVATAAVWSSAMAAVTFFAAAFLLFGECVLAVCGFFTYMRKVWSPKFPPSFLREKQTSSAKSENSSANSETTLKNAKNENASVVYGKKKTLTPQNAGYALLVVSVVFTIAAAALGCMDAEKWVEARTGYMNSKGWYAVSSDTDLQFDHTSVKEIEINVSGRDVVVVYEFGASRIRVSYFEKFPREFSVALQKDNESGESVLYISRSPEPPHDSAADKMFSFLFSPNELESQVVITIPSSVKDEIKIVGENIIFAK